MKNALVTCGFSLQSLKLQPSRDRWQLSGFQVKICFLKLLKDSNCFKFGGRQFYVLAPRNEITLEL